MALHQRRSTDRAQPSSGAPTTPPPEPRPEPDVEPVSPSPAPRPELGPEPPPAEVALDALGLWDVQGTLETAMFPVRTLAVGSATVDDPGERLVPGTKVVLRFDLPDGPYAMLGQAGVASAGTVTVAAAERGESRLRRFLADRAS